MCEIIKAYIKSECYKGIQNFGHSLNEILRHRSNFPLSCETKSIIEEFDRLFVKASSKELVLYRATSSDTIDPFCNDDVLVYPAYMSTSVSIGAAAIFLNRIEREKSLLFLKIKYSKQFLHICAANMNNEQEVILPRGCKFKIEKWTPDEMEQIPIQPFCPETKMLTFVP